MSNPGISFRRGQRMLQIAITKMIRQKNRLEKLPRSPRRAVEKVLGELYSDIAAMRLPVTAKQARKTMSGNRKKKHSSNVSPEKPLEDVSSVDLDNNDIAEVAEMPHELESEF